MNSTLAYQRVLIITLLIKLALAYFLPMSGDEAYFIVWARHLDYEATTGLAFSPTTNMVSKNYRCADRATLLDLSSRLQAASN
jgi:hypothetical protein